MTLANAYGWAWMHQGDLSRGDALVGGALPPSVPRYLLGLQRGRGGGVGEL